MNQLQPERESIWSIGRKWLPWYLLIVFLMVIGWTAFVAWHENTAGGHVGLSEIAIAVVRGSSPAAPLIPIYALMVISTLDVVGSVTMVTYRYLSAKFLKPLHDRLRQEGLEKGLEEGLEKGREEGLEKGREENQIRWVAWNQRRLLAELNGEPFDEPPPGSNENGKQTMEE